MKRVLIVGGGLQQLPSIRAVRELKWESVVVDQNDRALGSREADMFYQVDIKDQDRVLQIAQQEMDQRGLDAVYTAGTDFSTTVAYVAEKLNLPGIPYVWAVKTRNKAKMRMHLKKLGVEIPAYQVFLYSSEKAALHIITEFSEKQGFPLVLKPTMNMGSRGVRSISNADEILEAIRATLPFSSGNELIVESFIHGDEYSVDVLVYKGKVHVIGLADRHIQFSPFFIETGHSIPSTISSVDFDKMVLVLAKIAKGFSIANGALKGDIFIDNGKIIVGEFASRLSGGFMSGWTIPISSGLYPVHQALRIAAGVPVEVRRTSSVRSKYVVEQAVFSIPGILENIQGINLMLLRKYCRHVFVNKKVGDIIQLVENNTEKVLHFIVEGFSREEVETLRVELLSNIRVELKSSVEVTEQYLFSQKAFPVLGVFIHIDQNQHEKDAMHDYYGTVHMSRNNVLPVYPLSRWEDEHTINWQNRSVASVIQGALRQKKIVLSNSGFALGAIFWRAIERGGDQAVQYIIETLQREGGRALYRWCDILHT